MFAALRVEGRRRAEGGRRRAEGGTELLLAPRSSLLAPRLGITLTEVLISIGILTIGLLGVAALFPVGSYYLQKGEIADRGSAVGQAAFNDLIGRGMLNPAAWRMFDPVVGPNQATYTAPFKSRLAQTIADNVANEFPPKNQTRLLSNQILNAFYGSAYVIDPIGVNGSPLNPSIPADRIQYWTNQRFPFAASLASYSQASWKPWSTTGLPAFILQKTPQWAVVRLTIPEGNGAPITNPAAEKIFTSNDDLALDVPAKSNLPSVQAWETDSATPSPNPLARKFRGDYSWMATIVPPTSEARNALASDPTAFEYEVSVAVFYKRIIDNLAVAGLGQDPMPTERLVNAQIFSTGLNGGQILASQLTSDPSKDPFNALKPGNWVVVCGPHPASTDNINRFVLRWYRVLAVEGKDTKLDKIGNPGAPAGDPPRRLVSLRGAEWPWQPAKNGLGDDYDLSNNLCIAIIPNVVAVHSKTIRLEANSAWRVQ